MEIWHDPAVHPSSINQPTTRQLSQLISEDLGIDFVSLDVRQRFYQDVVETFVNYYLEGQTPNPCLFCNPQIKWGILQSFALENGADYFATGHYARLERSKSGVFRLLKAVDQSKDQSYVLSMLTQSQLSKTLLPLGELKKSEVRARAQTSGLPAADRAESQDLCFLGQGDYRDFINRFSPGAIEPGDIVDVNGKVLGQHSGLPFYTIGQLKGIRIASSEPYYVIAKDLDQNQLVVGYAREAGAMFLTANHANWISGYAPQADQRYDVMIRYRSKPVSALLLDYKQGQFRLKFDHPLRGITPGQVVVLYQGEECLGGGVID
jgi:tRNA-specific 2-thiouridylase